MEAEEGRKEREREREGSVEKLKCYGNFTSREKEEEARREGVRERGEEEMKRERAGEREKIEREREVLGEKGFTRERERERERERGYGREGCAGEKKGPPAVPWRRK